MGGNVSTASPTPAGGWYADPLDASLLRWWDGTAWSKQTMPADAALSPSTADSRSPLTAVPPLLSVVPRPDEPYVPANSVFRMAESVAGDAYVPEWSGFEEISDEVALSGVPVQLALTSTPSEPPIPVSIDAFPTLRGESPVTAPAKEPVWKVEAPLAAPVDQLFPVALSADVFPVAAAPAATAFPAAPVAAPLAAPAAAAFVPQPSGDAFPGIVPNAAPAAYMPATPMADVPVAPAMPMQAMPMQAMPTPMPPVAMPVPPVAAPTLFAEPPAPAAPFAPAVPQPTIYAGPPQIVAPISPATPSEIVPATPVAMPAPVLMPSPVAMPTSPAEYRPTPTQAAPSPTPQYQPNPGDYVPFDPNAVHLEPVPVIPFSSRDPFNSASTARPGMRAYAAAPIGPTGSTWTGGLAFMLLAPLISAATFFVWTQLTPLTQISADSLGWLPFALVGIGLIGLASAQIDRSTLARRGYFDLASPFWVLLIPPLVYLIVRALRLRGQGRGAAPAIGLWVLSYVASYALIGLISVGWLSAPTPERVAFVETTMQQQLAAQHITATVKCPAVTTFSPGTTFACTVTPQQGSPLTYRVTVNDWAGNFTPVLVTSGTS